MAVHMPILKNNQNTVRTIPVLVSHPKQVSIPQNGGSNITVMTFVGSCHKRQKPQAPTPQAPIHNRQTRKVVNAKVINRYTNLT